MKIKIVVLTILLVLCYQDTFTEDRNILVIKPEGGEIVRTKLYGFSTIDKAVPEPILYRKRAIIWENHNNI
jgi:hypothetical protein